MAVAVLALGAVMLYQVRTATGPEQATDRVELSLNDFGPDGIVVPVGTTVTWHWDGVVIHDLGFADCVATPAKADGTFQRTFTEPGTYPYRCNLHGPMRGEVVVTAATSAEAAASRSSS